MGKCEKPGAGGIGCQSAKELIQLARECEAGASSLPAIAAQRTLAGLSTPLPELPAPTRNPSFSSTLSQPPVALTVSTYTKAKAWKYKQAQPYLESHSLTQGHPASHGFLTPGSKFYLCTCCSLYLECSSPRSLFGSLLLILQVSVQMSPSLITHLQHSPPPLPRNFQPLPCFIFQVHLSPANIVLSPCFPSDSAFGQLAL